MDYASLRDWFFAHDWQMLLVTTYVLLNVGPRPHPENLTGGYKKIFWLIVDRLAWLSAEKVPGDWKMIFSESPLPPVEPSPRVHAVDAITMAADAPAMPPTVADAKPPIPEDDPPRGAA
jgi:hypothetical protein